MTTAKQMKDDKGQRTEDRGQRTEERGKRKEERGKRKEERGKRKEERGKRIEDGGRRTEDRGQRTEDFKLIWSLSFNWHPMVDQSLGVFLNDCEVEIVLVKLQTVNVSFEAWTIHQTSPTQKEQAHWQRQSAFWKLCRGKSSAEGNSSVQPEHLSNPPWLYIFKEAQLIRTGLVLWSLKGAPTVHCNFPLLSFSLHTAFKKRIAAACEPILWNREGLVNDRRSFGQNTWPIYLDSWFQMVNLLSKFQLPGFYGLGVKVFWRFGEKGDSFNQSFS